VCGPAHCELYGQRRAHSAQQTGRERWTESFSVSGPNPSTENMSKIVLLERVGKPVVGVGVDDDGIAPDEGSVGDPSVKLSPNRAADPGRCRSKHHYLSKLHLLISLNPRAGLCAGFSAKYWWGRLADASMISPEL